MKKSIPELLEYFECQINNACEILPKPGILTQAMEYTCLNGGKRLRPLLIYASANLNQHNIETVSQVAIAIELIHCYSLVHDDLPSMDNDDYRRGQPSCHRAFGEGIAILTGDALQSLAFQILSAPSIKLNPIVTLKIIHEIAQSSGIHGMAQGQAIDLESTGKKLDIAQLDKMHLLKTGALIKASVVSGYMAGYDEASIARINFYENLGAKIGLLFQIVDDILDVTQNSQTLGKTAGKDAINNKPTYVSTHGLEHAKTTASNLYNEIDEITTKIENNELLREIVKDIYTTTN